MKTGIKRIFGILVSSAMGLSGIPCDVLAVEKAVNTQITAPSASTQNIAPVEPIEDIWLAITKLEQETNAVTESDYAELIPQIEQMVLSYSDYREGSLEYTNGILFWWSDDTLNGYNPSFREKENRVAAEDPQTLFAEQNSSYLAPNPESAWIAGTDTDDAGRALNTCAFLPYSGTDKDYFAIDEQYCADVAAYTGGNVLCYKNTDATIDRLAAAIKSCALVQIGSHGSEGYFGILTDAGLNDADYNGKHAYKGSTHYKTVEGEQILNYQVWMIDGTAITNHMDQDAPGNFVLTDCCEGMKTDALCKPLRERGVAAIYGYSESMSSESGSFFSGALLKALCRHRTLADAIHDMKMETGCQWDAIMSNYTYQQAQEYGVAFPIVVSEEDHYPGVGKVNRIQNVRCTWTLPVRLEQSEQIVLKKNYAYTDSYRMTLADAGEPVASVSADVLPAGMDLTRIENRILLSGTPTKKGYVKSVLTIKMENGKTYRKTIEFVTADYSVIAEKTWQSGTFRAYDFGKWSRGAYSKDLGDAFVSTIWALPRDRSVFQIGRAYGVLPLSLEYGFDAEKHQIYVRSAKALVKSGYYHATAPGTYTMTMQYVTTEGDVYQHRVNVNVTPVQTYDITIYKTFYESSPVSYNVTKSDSEDYWDGGAVKRITVTDGALPKGMYLANSWDKPFGLYGVPEETGSFTVKCRIANHSDYYNYTFVVSVKEIPELDETVSIQNADPIYAGDTIRLELEDSASNYFIRWQKKPESSGEWRTVFEKTAQTTYNTIAKDANYWFRAEVMKTVNGVRYRTFSPEVFVNPCPKLTGSVSFSAGAYYGIPVEVTMSGVPLKLSKEKPAVLHYSWKLSDSDDAEWEIVSQETAYTPTADAVGKTLCLSVWADKYQGLLQTEYRTVIREMFPNNAMPAVPKLLSNSGYTEVCFTNSAAAQEYFVSRSAKVPEDWSNAVSPEYDGEEIVFTVQPGTFTYVFTRFKETETHYAGSQVPYAVIYNGKVTAVEGVQMGLMRMKLITDPFIGRMWVPEAVPEQDEHGVHYITSDDVIRVTVKPIPEDASFQGIRGEKFLIKNGAYKRTSPYGAFYTSAACDTFISADEYYTTVYFKAKENMPINNMELRVEFTKGYNDIATDAVQVNVSSGTGDYLISSFQAENATLTAGNAAEGFQLSAYPGKAAFTGTAVQLISGTGNAPTVMIDADTSTYSVDASEADPGLYSFAVSKNSTAVTGSIIVRVLPEYFTVTLSSNDGTGRTEEYQVPPYEEFILPKLPWVFPADGCSDAEGWSAGAVGESITVSEDMTVRVNWVPHVHTMQYQPEIPPACIRSGFAAHYYCETCGKEFDDEEGYMAAPTIDYYFIPATGHATVLIEESAPTCTEHGNCAYYACMHCDRFFEDADAETEIIDYKDVMIEATGHNWGKVSYTWAKDNSSVTAKRVCKTDSSHVETETVDTVMDQVEPTYEEKGCITYIATFTNAAFAEQKKVIEIPMLTTTTETTTTQPIVSQEDDLNADGKVSIGDAVLLARYVTEDHDLQAEQLDNIRNAKADQDGDGCITILDLMKLLQKVTSFQEG